MKSKAVVLISSLVLGGAAFAQIPAASDLEVSFNAGVVTDYRFRGLSQTRFKPAIQAGADVSHKSGFYIGTWGSHIKWIKDGGGDTSLELDVYGGYKFEVGDFGFDVGVLRYLYPGSSLPVNPDTTEIYGAGTWGPVTLKYSHAVTNLFGTADSKNSYYVDLSASFPIGESGFSITPHIGYQKVKNSSPASYTDYSITLGYDFGNGLSASLAWVDTDTDVYVAPNGKNLGRSGVLLGLKYDF